VLNKTSASSKDSKLASTLKKRKQVKSSIPYLRNALANADLSQVKSGLDSAQLTERTLDHQISLGIEELSVIETTVDQHEDSVWKGTFNAR
jgi:hypothetical protein